MPITFQISVHQNVGPLQCIILNNEISISQYLPFFLIWYTWYDSFLWKKIHKHRYLPSNYYISSTGSVQASDRFQLLIDTKCTYFRNWNIYNKILKVNYVYADGIMLRRILIFNLVQASGTWISEILCWLGPIIGQTPVVILERRGSNEPPYLDHVWVINRNYLRYQELHLEIQLFHDERQK